MIRATFFRAMRRLRRTMPRTQNDQQQHFDALRSQYLAASTTGDWSARDRALRRLDSLLHKAGADHA